MDPKLTSLRALALALACALPVAGRAAEAAGPSDCQLALDSASALAARFDHGDPGLTYQDATDLAWVGMPEYRETLAVRGCPETGSRFEAVAMSGLRSTRVDVRALLLQACTASTGPLADPGALVAREAMREQGVAGLRMLGDDASACAMPATASPRASR